MGAWHDQALIWDLGRFFFALFVLEETAEALMLELVKQKLDVGVHANDFCPDASDIRNDV